MSGYRYSRHLLGDAVAVRGDKVRGHELLHVGHRGQRRLADLPDVGRRGFAHHRWHDGAVSGHGVLHCRLTQGVGLLHVRLGGQVSGGALEIIRDRPMELITQGLLDHVRHDRGGPAQLGVTEGVPGPLFRQEAAVRVVATLGDADGAVAMLLYLGLDRRDEALLIELHLREQGDNRDALIRHQGPGGGDPARVAAHDLDHEELGGGGAHGPHVKGCLQGGGGNVLGHGAEARAVVSDRQVIVHGLRHMDGLDRVAQGLGELGDLVAGVGGVAPAVVEEVTDVVSPEDLDQTLILALVGLQALQLVAARTEAAGRGIAERRDVLGGLQVGVDQVLGQGADDAVAACVDVGDLVRVGAGGLDHPAGRGVDHRSDTAGLGVKGILRGHGSTLVRSGLKWFSRPRGPG